MSSNPCTAHLSMPGESGGIPSFPPSMLIQYEGCFPRVLLSLASFCPRCEVFFKAPEHFIPMRGVLLRGASHEPKDVFVSEGVLHVGVMGVALCREGGNDTLQGEPL